MANPEDVTDKPNEQAQLPAHNDDGGETTTPTTAAEAKPAAEEDDSDFEDLDDVLDDFNKPKQPKEAAAAAATSTTTTTEPSNNLELNATTTTTEADFDEKDFQRDFLKQLEADMTAKLMAAGIDTEEAGPSSAAAAGDAATAATGFDSKQVDELEKQFADAGINPEDFFKELLAEAMQKPPPPAPSTSKGNDDTASSAAKTAAAGENNPADEKGSFQDTIQRTLERMQESGDKATAATNEDGDMSNDLLEQLLKAMDGAGGGGGAGGGDMDLNQMFMGMMEQLSNKEMLYEPMKELHTKFGPWLQENRDKVAADELERYETQARLVGEIVNKFDEPDFSDDKPECRSYIWERMQTMQAAGSPPDDLIANPLLDELAAGDNGGPNGPAPPECPQQ